MATGMAVLLEVNFLMFESNLSMMSRMAVLMEMLLEL
jgi:hypothetical protein